ncbi:MAG: DNA repair protein RadA [Gammaproteobacteria bacterium]|nr:DNA repair protein RadA [Gammaproteobacteria bacterium]
MAPSVPSVWRSVASTRASRISPPTPTRSAPRTERGLCVARGGRNTIYQCQSCGGQSSKWSGQCPDCGAWNTLVETVAAAQVGKPVARFKSYSGENSGIVRLTEVKADVETRSSIGIGELDRVLGGGLVAGSVILIGGDPGIGKSTLLMQAMAGVQGKALYVSGEESAAQVAMRARRLGVTTDNVALLTETHLEQILAEAATFRPDVMVIDSIQTLYSGELASAPGAVGQVRECAAHLVRYAKAHGTTVFLVGHVTKEGALAGPRVLEHMVDAVLYFEGDHGSRYRVVRAVKNRYGEVNELGVFSMTDQGLREVANPSAIFLARHEKPVPGSVVMVTREGTRPLLVEVQALVDESQIANPRRVTVGLEHNRLAILLAVLHRHAGIATGDQDVFVNVVGGVRVSETGIDLAVLLAILSSWRNRPLPHDMVVFGEVGLTGEIRPVQNGPERLREASKHGFRRALVPQANAPRGGVEGLEITTVTHLKQVLDHI